jgi:DNA invertase Pin-like site-specific DNA recombinase
MTTLAYLRVSTDQQDLDNQRHGVIEYARKNNLDPLVYFEDTVSGKKSWRDRDLGKLIDRSKPNDVLLVSEISRLARSTLQVLEILQECTKKELIVHVAKSNMIMDGSLNSRITAVVLGLAAEIEREFISARTTEALARRKAEGKPIGRPLGSHNHSKKLDKYTAEIKEMLAKNVHKTSICRMYGVSPQTLYTWMQENDLKRFIKSDKPVKEKEKAKAEEVKKETKPKNALRLLNSKRNQK